MADDRLRRCILVLGLVLIAAAGVPSAGAQGLSGAETAAINNLLGAGVLGAGVLGAGVLGGRARQACSARHCRRARSPIRRA